MDFNNNGNFNQFNNFKNNNSKKVIDLDAAKYKKLLKTVLIVVGIFIAFLIVMNSFFYTVDEREQVVVTQFGKIVKVVLDDKDSKIINDIKGNEKTASVKIETGKGLHFKLPIIQQVEPYTNMLLTYDTQPEKVVTADKKNILLDNFAQWKIENPALFMLNIGTVSEAHQRIDESIFSKIRVQIGKIEAHTLITDKQFVEGMLEGVRLDVNEQLKVTGIVIEDIRIKRTEYTQDIYNNIFEQMITEREAVATQYRSEGQETAQKVRSYAQKEATIIEANAYKQAEQVKGEGDAEALKIYAEAYNQDPKFYEFWRTLESYKKIVDEDTTIVIKPDSEIAKYLSNK